MANTLADVVKLLSCTGAGLLFGFAAEKGRVHIPSVIQNQMSMKEFTMMKVFLSAAAAGLVGFSVLSAISSTQNLFRRIRETYRSGYGTKTTIAFLLGGALLGTGMTVAGSCPGMVLVQVGAGVRHSLVTLCGCFCGTALYGILLPKMETFILGYAKPRGSWFDKVLGLHFSIPSMLLACGLYFALAILEYLFPWKTEWAVGTGGLFKRISWVPIAAGCLMGSLQLAVAFLVKDSLGGSSAYCTVLSKAGLRNIVSYFNGYERGIGNWWQVFFWVGGIAGAGLSAYSSDSWGVAVGVRPWAGFLGGALMLFGARMASGCTSGHGLSGMALLSTESFITVPAMFAGGIITALILFN